MRIYLNIIYAYIVRSVSLIRIVPNLEFVVSINLNIGRVCKIIDYIVKLLSISTR
jgi:hypothetical protein